jgi:hypothetical protein
MGSASYPEDSRIIEELLALADRRMYWHKREFHAARAQARGTAALVH